MAADWGYDEINLNVGCPSDRVQSGAFGACLMREPDLVAECMAAMREAVNIPVTVKCRIGVDDQDPETALPQLVTSCREAGVEVFIIHARKAWLEGLSPKENREIPLLDYPLVYRLKQQFPDISIIINGGIETLDQTQTHLAQVDGVLRETNDAQSRLAAQDARQRAHCCPWPPYIEEIQQMVLVIQEMLGLMGLL